MIEGGKGARQENHSPLRGERGDRKAVGEGFLLVPAPRGASFIKPPVLPGDTYIRVSQEWKFRKVLSP